MTLDSLIHRYLDDRAGLATEELDALAEGLRAEPARAIALHEQLLLDDLLAQKLALDRQNFPAQVSQRIADYERGQDELNDQVADLRSIAESEIERPANWTGNSAWVRAAVALGGLAAVALVALAVNWWPRSPQPVAKVLNVEGEVRAVVGMGIRRPISGEAVLSDQLIETPEGGSIAVGYADGTSLHIGGRSGRSSVSMRADEQGAKRVVVHRGEIMADVAPQRAGAMTFQTPHAVATVLGTKLRLTVSESSTLLDVTEGRVRLDRLADGRSIDVAAHESGLATSELLQVRELAWPDSREGLMYVFSPFGLLDLPRPAMAARNPATGGLIETVLATTGDAHFDESTKTLMLSGGSAQSAEAGADLLPLWRQQQEFTLELVLSADAMQPAEQSCLVALGPAERPNFAILQDRAGSTRGEDAPRLRFVMHGESDQPAAEIDLALPSDERTVHLAIVYGNGLLIAYRDGEETARADAPPGLQAAWLEGPLTVGGDALGRRSWHGVVDGLALFRRTLEQDELRRNVRHFNALSLVNGR